MKDYNDSSWLTQNAWGRWGEDDEVGALNEVSAADVLGAVALIKEGRIYDLETERFKGMPVWDGHCGFEMLTYASPWVGGIWRSTPPMAPRSTGTRAAGWTMVRTST